MKSIGTYLMIGGIGSILLNQFGYEFKLLMWIDMWGENVAWGIRGGAIVVGAILFFMSAQPQAEEPATEEAES